MYLGHEDGALMNGTSALMKKTPQSSLTPSTMWDYSEKMAVNDEAGCYQTLNLPALWSWTSGLQNCEK